MIGRAFIIVWPFSHFGVQHVPKTFNQTSMAPLGLGLLGALPLAGWRRRRRVRAVVP